jgi:PAS domain S-box-containing protein
VQGYASVGALHPAAATIAVVLLPDGERAAWLAESLGSHPALAEIPLLGVSPAECESEPSFAADDWIQWPSDPEQLLLRIERWRAEGRARQASTRAGRLVAGIAAAGELLAEQTALEHNLDRFVQSVCALLDAPEGVLIVLGKNEREAWVLASRAGIHGPPVPLDEPAALALLARSRDLKPTVLRESEGDGLLLRALELEDGSGLEHTVTWPVAVSNQLAGSLVLALPPKLPFPLEQIQPAGRVLGDLVGTALQGSPLWKRLREQTKPVNLDRVESELRSRTLRRYREFFESSSDGVVVVDSGVRIVHINRAGAMMTGYAEGWLLGRKLTDIVASHHQEALAEIVQRGLEGTPLQSFDLQLATTSGDFITVDVSASSLMLDQRVLVLTFRDVSEARAIEDELTKTKEFLERLIASAVDAIVAADAVDGHIILFNQGAENLFGRSAEEAVDRLTLADLFPEEEYEDLLRQLHSPSSGGPGRLEQTHLHARDAMGQHLPVSLTASTILEEQREVAVVAILTDLREQIQIQERLAIAQEKLEVTEKQALIAELAGTTAHELNQPLTSVMGYAELLAKKAGEDSPLYRPIQVIMQEAERMAEIVRKIGKITRYETKSYVGATQILDLERAAEE